MKKKKIKNNKYIIIAIAAALFIAAAIILLLKLMPTRAHVNLTEYYGSPSEGHALITVDARLQDDQALLYEDKVYIPVSVTDDCLNQRFYWDEAGSQILYTGPSGTESTPAGAAGDKVYISDGIAYLDMEFIKEHTDLEYYTLENPSRIAIRTQFKDIKTVTAGKNTAIRLLGGIKSEILTDVKKGTVLLVRDDSLTNWMKVATSDGYLGYVQKKHLTEESIISEDRSFVAEEYSQLALESPVELVWHSVDPEGGAVYPSTALSAATGVNVISPTVFYLKDNSGAITSIITSEYVAAAHAAGIKVWGLVSNFTSYSQAVTTLDLLSDTGARTTLVDNLVKAALSSGMDGINVDLEAMVTEVGYHYTQFLRELYVKCHENNLILSVDVPYPEDYYTHYNYKELGQIADYVIAMGYDEHTDGSETGSVASDTWCRRGIENLLMYVDTGRLINGIPFYSRLWKTSGETVSSEAVSMDRALELVNASMAELIWDEDAGQYYAEWEQDGAYCQIWVEGLTSVEKRMELIKEYNLAGVAAWQLGLENADVWSAISGVVSELK